MSTEKNADMSTDITLLLSEWREAERTDRPRALLLARRLAALGVTDGEVAYARYLLAGEYLPADTEEACRWFSRAAAKADPIALYEFSRLLPPNERKRADRMALTAAALGCREAYRAAGEALLREHLLGEKSEEEANAYFFAAAEAGDRDAVLLLIDRAAEGHGMPRSLGCAKWFSRMLPTLCVERIHAFFRFFSVSPVPYMAKAPDAERLLLALCEGEALYPLVTDRLAERLISLGHLTYALRLSERLMQRGEPKEALTVLQSAAEKGEPKAALALGDLYLSGRLGEEDPFAAERSYTLAAELGDAVGYRRLGDLALEGRCGTRNLPLAISFYDRGAAAGDASSAKKAEKIRTDREEMCRRGEAVFDTAPEEAFRLFSLSELLGYPPAKTRLAECYLRGIGTEPDRHEAFIRYRDAYEAGEREALLPLALCYARGIGTAQSFSRADALIREAERAGDTRGRSILLSLYEKKKKKLLRRLYSDVMHLFHLSRYADAARVAERGAFLGEAHCTFLLGCFYEFGVGVPCNRERAFLFYERAKALGYTDPRSTFKARLLKSIHQSDIKEI